MYVGVYIHTFFGVYNKSEIIGSQGNAYVQLEI